VIAPAFPAQGRVTRGGRQLVRDPGGYWSDVGIDVAAILPSKGIEVRSGPPEQGGGVFLCDATTDDDLDRIAARGPELTPPVLWCGSGGLARALAGPTASLPLPQALPAPVRLIVGTAHEVTCAQLDRLPATHKVRVTRLDLPSDCGVKSARVALVAMAAAAASDSRPG
jgi:uncharacterized protein YgbK (DUF1537 family)